MRKLILAALPLFAIALPAQAQLPDAKALVAKYDAAIGGEAFMKLKSVHETGTFELPAMGVSATIDVMRAAPNKNLVHVSIPGMGEVVRGFDGTVGYSMNPMQGNALMTEKELAPAAEEAQFGATLRLPEFVTSMETVEKTSMGGQDCYKVKLVWKSGRTTFDCYAVDTGLLAGTIATQETPQGPVDVTTTLADYKPFGGIKVATKMSQSAMGQDQVITISNVEFDKVDDAAFALPDAIKALVPKK
jgi:hypothetical protein